MLRSQALANIYELYRLEGARLTCSIERFLVIGEPPQWSVLDLKRNEPHFYLALCTDELDNLQQIYEKLLSELKAADNTAVRDCVLNGLEFIQRVVATALWRYDQRVGDELEAFAREFDRLDIPSERFRLYQQAQNMPTR